jgi:hypothetical protein
MEQKLIFWPLSTESSMIFTKYLRSDPEVQDLRSAHTSSDLRSGSMEIKYTVGHSADGVVAVCIRVVSLTWCSWASPHPTFDVWINVKTANTSTQQGHGVCELCAISSHSRGAPCKLCGGTS